MLKGNKIFAVLLTVLLLSSLAVSFLPSLFQDPAATKDTTVSYQEQLPKSGDKVAILETNLGIIKFKLFLEDAPETVANFEKLATSGFYDGVKFHRVIQGFMIQTGDPLSKDADPSNDGKGGPGYTIKDEFSSKLKNIPYAVAMANSSLPDTNGSQFFINEATNSHLDGKHTVFGQVYSGQDIVQKIAAVAVNEEKQPSIPVLINKATVSNYDEASVQNTVEPNLKNPSLGFRILKWSLWLLLGIVAILGILLLILKSKLGSKIAPPSLAKKQRKKKNKNYGKLKKHKK